jgi:hypothetical protein
MFFESSFKIGERLRRGRLDQYETQVGERVQHDGKCRTE